MGRLRDPMGLSRPLGWALGALLALLIVARFTGLDRVPPGFYVDEAAIAAQVICLRTTGADADGNPWPLFAPVLGGGQASPPTLYLGALWTAVWGDGVASFRGLAAFAGMVIIASVVAVTASWSAQSVAIPLAALIALSSPWLFHLSRVWWDPIIAAALWAAALAAYFVRAHRQPPEIMPTQVGYLVRWCLFGLLSVAAAYAYPPVRIQIAASWLLLAVFDRGWRHRWGWLTAALIAGLLAIPLLAQYADPDFRARGSMLAIWNDGWLAGQGKTLANLPKVLLDQMAAHLSPGYLFFHGDHNLRHGSGYGGLIGATEIAALAACLLFCGRLPRVAFLLLGLTLAGILPAALTWESTPHALRSLGAVGPWLMAVGVITATLTTKMADQQARITAGISVIVLASALLYGWDYQTRYREASGNWFDANARPLQDPRYPDLAKRYLLMREGAPCNPSDH
jgi:hypothetical protein